MQGQEKGSGRSELDEGMRQLRRHRPDLAVRNLRVAAEACPASRPGELSRRLYWLAVALLRLDRPELALKSLASAQKLRPRGFARAAYRSRVNEYGMPRRATPELDDFYAFYSIQVCSYLSRKEKPRFDSVAEKDAAVRILGDSWRTISRSGRLIDMSAGEKLKLFREYRVSFPSFGLSGQPCDSIVHADFRRKKGLSGDERCPCGSGLPFRQCCGRTASLRELSCE